MTKYTVQNRVVTGAPPPWAVDGLGEAVRCYTEHDARRVAKALDLLDEMESGPQIVLSGDISADLLAEALSTPRRIQFVPATRPALPEDEIMQRAREAAVSAIEWFPDAVPGADINRITGIRAGTYDSHVAVKAASFALCDLSKPLAEIVPPPVDPDLIEARKIAAETIGLPHAPGTAAVAQADAIVEGKCDHHEVVRSALTALKRGRELASADWLAIDREKRTQC